MREYVYFGSAPCDEVCVQSTDPDYEFKAREECNRYIELLTRHLASMGHPKETWPEGFRLKVNASHHDFGTYYEVVAVATTEEALDLACELEADVPVKWERPS